VEGVGAIKMAEVGWWARVGVVVCDLGGPYVPMLALVWTALVGHLRIGGIVRSRHRCVRNHNHVVKVGTHPAVCPSVTSGLDRGSRSLSDVVGSYPERETNHWATLIARAVIGGDLSRSPDCFIRRRQLTLEGFVSCSDTGTVSICCKEIDTHPPEFRPITHPAHGPIFPDHSGTPVTKHPPGRVFRNDARGQRDGLTRSSVS
jgi:hypothetical protein